MDTRQASSWTTQRWEEKYRRIGAGLDSLHVDETARADEDQKLCPQHLLQTHPPVVELQTFL